MRDALERDVNRKVAALDGHVVTASFGVASFEKADDRLEDLLSAADEAMYKSKDSGRNRVTTADRSGEIEPPPPSDTKELEGYARS
jgi:diguanylate cyclase (GGDEF)-like protein